MIAQICRRCLKLNDELPATSFCSGTRAHHVWTTVGGALGIRLSERRRLRDERARAIAARERTERS